jgi:hypothetical protein
MTIKPSDLNESIRGIPLPENMRRLPVSKQGFPVPFFAAKHPETGEWDFRVVYPETTLKCMKHHLCWICGQQLGSKKAFVVGPMCVVTKTTAEPPCHYSCAQYATIACPFLAAPRMKRNTANLPDSHIPAAGTMIMRNPGVAAVLVTRSWKPFKDGHGGILVRMGPPEAVEWYAERGRANRRQVLDSIESGIGLLLDECDKEETQQERTEAHDMLRNQLADIVNHWLPPIDATVAS